MSYPLWNNANGATLNPGDGAWIRSPEHRPVCPVYGDFLGRSAARPAGEQPSANGGKCIVNQFNHSAASGKLDDLGFPVAEGDQIQQWNVGSQQWVTTATCQNGSWSPAAPTVAIGESFIVQSDSSISSRPPWTNSPVNMVAWWKAENNANDSIGNNNGTMVNGSTYAAGEVGQAFSLTGENYVSVPDAPGLNPTNAITVECWLYRQAVGGFDPVVKKAGTGDGGMEYGYTLEFTGNNLLFWIYSSSGGWCSSGITAPIQLGQWYHVAGVYDGKYLSVYVNGQLTACDLASGCIVPSRNALCIGADPSDPPAFPWIGG